MALPSARSVSATCTDQVTEEYYFFRARETNFLVAAEEQSKNLESQLPWAHKDWGGGG